MADSSGYRHQSVEVPISIVPIIDIIPDASQSEVCQSLFHLLYMQ
jgi:hypothetical protein